MTKQQLFRRFITTTMIYIIAVIIGIIVRLYDSTKDVAIYTTYKDMIPFIIAIPAAWLGYCLQRRNSYLQQLRVLWSALIVALQKAHYYTYIEAPSDLQFSETVCQLSAAIEEIRGVFKNINETDKENGLYPFEPIKDIFGLIKDLEGRNKLSVADREKIREKIFVLWRDARKQLLKEFDRESPVFTHSHWVQLDKAEVYSTYQIPRRPT